jgi:serine/threonine protein kinase
MPLELQPGDLYAGNIRVLNVLGAGAFACVYKVEVPGYDRPMALKLTKEPVTAGDQAQRALREITILRSLTNPHVVKSFDCGLRPDGHIYMLMEFLDGLPLDDWHKFEKPLPPAQSVALVHQVCLGLAEAHAKGIVHRDVKPENIFVENSGHVRLLDFGLARSWDGSPVIGVNATKAHMVVGTPHYSQPEQLRTRQLSPSSDVYSLGMILYELLSACSPFHRERSLQDIKHEFRKQPLMWLKCHAESPIVPLTEQPGCAELPDALVRGVMRSLDKDPAARPPDAGALANILGTVLHRDMGQPQDPASRRVGARGPAVPARLLSHRQRRALRDQAAPRQRAARARRDRVERDPQPSAAAPDHRRRLGAGQRQAHPQAGRAGPPRRVFGGRLPPGTGFLGV